MNVEPYDVYTSDTGSRDCDYCGECDEVDGPHAHELFVSRDGASARTGDELLRVFLEDVADLTTFVIPADAPDPTGWCEDSDDSQYLNDLAIGEAESALGDAGLSVTWNDGYVIERVRET